MEHNQREEKDTDAFKKRKLKNVTVILDKGETLIISRPLTESKRTFLKRIEFYLKCIKHDLSPYKCQTYTNIYINKLKYGVTYSKFIEDEIKSINNSEY